MTNVEIDLPRSTTRVEVKVHKGYCVGFGPTLRQLRVAANLSQRALAGVVDGKPGPGGRGTSATGVIRVERGQSNPRPSTVIRWAPALGVHFVWVDA